MSRKVSGLPAPDGPVCVICGDQEPIHVHLGNQRIEDYFTVGRGESDFLAAVRWRDRAEAAEKLVEIKARGEIGVEAPERQVSPLGPDPK